MPYDPDQSYVIPKFAYQAPVAADVGDPDGGASANLADLLGVLRFFRGSFTDQADRDALTGLADGHFVILKTDENKPRIDVWHTGAWRAATTTQTSVTGRLVPLTESPPGSGRYPLPYSGEHEQLFIETIPQHEGAERDYTVDDSDTPICAVFNSGKGPKVGQVVYGTSAILGLTGTDAATLGGYVPSTAVTPNAVVVRGPDGSIAGVAGSNAETLDGHATAVSPSHTPDTIPVHDGDGNLDATTLTGLLPSTAVAASVVVVRNPDGTITGIVSGGGGNADTLDGYNSAVSPAHTPNTIPVHDASGGLDATTLGGAAPATASTPNTIVKRLGDGSITGVSSNADTLDGYNTLVSPAHAANRIPVHDASGGLDATTLAGAVASSAVTANAIVKRDGSGAIAGAGSNADTLDGYDTLVSPSHAAFKIPVHDASGGLDATTLNGVTATTSATAGAIVKRNPDGTITGVSTNADTLDGYTTAVSPAHTANTIPVHSASGGLDATTLGGAAPATTATASTIVKRNGDGTITGVSSNADTLDGYNTAVSPAHTANTIPVHDASGGLDATTLGGAAPSTAATANAIVKRNADGSITGVTASGKCELHVFAYNASTQSITGNNSSQTKLNFGTETTDTYNQFASGTFTALSAGEYIVEVAVRPVRGTSGSNNHCLMLYKNGAEFMSHGWYAASADIEYYVAHTVTFPVTLAAGDTVELYQRVTNTVTNQSGNNKQYVKIYNAV
jgi:hypothetical protein